MSRLTRRQCRPNVSSRSADVLIQVGELCDAASAGFASNNSSSACSHTKQNASSLAFFIIAKAQNVW